MDIALLVAGVCNPTQVGDRGGDLLSGNPLRWCKVRRFEHLDFQDMEKD